MTMTGDARRIELEREMTANMVKMYYSDNDNCSPLCAGCEEFQYAKAKLDHCLNLENIPTCNKYTIHCYDLAHRKRIKVVMRYSGLRMILEHPMQALRHLADELNSPKRKSS
jgi:hypothetical protein